jgi:hypothetical protein
MPTRSYWYDRFVLCGVGLASCSATENPVTTSGMDGAVAGDRSPAALDGEFDVTESDALESATADDASPMPVCIVGTVDGGAIDMGTMCYPLSSEPAGSCSAAGICSFCAFIQCPNGEPGPRMFHNCSCLGGRWQCTFFSQDQEICNYAALDAYVDVDAGAGGE